MRERRFIRFASVEYHAQIYMTPQDFLESVIEADPRRNKYFLFLISVLLCLLLKKYYYSSIKEENAYRRRHRSCQIENPRIKRGLIQILPQFKR